MTKKVFILAILTLLLPCSAFAQLTRLDTMLAATLGGMVPMANGIPATMAGDSSLAPLFAMMPKTTFSVTPIFYVSQLSATVQRTDSGARMDVLLRGELLQPMNSIAQTRSFGRSIDFQPTANDWNVLENNGSRYVHFNQPPGGFWSNVVEPIIVVLGAAAVVALFFLIRS